MMEDEEGRENQQIIAEIIVGSLEKNSYLFSVIFQRTRLLFQL